MIGISLSRGVIQLLFSTSLLLIFLWPVSELVSRFIGEPNLKKFLTWWLVLTPTVLTYCHFISEDPVKKASSARLVANYHQAYYLNLEKYSLLIVLMEIRNTSSIQIAATNFRVIQENSSLLVHPLLLPRGGMMHIMLSIPPNDMDIVLLSEEFIQFRATEKPIQPGLPVRGWLFFEIHDQVDTAKLAVSFKDADGGMYEVPIQVKNIPPFPDHRSIQEFSDITYPFRERSVVENIAKARERNSHMVNL